MLLNEVEAKSKLYQAGIRVNRSGMATSVEQAISMSEEFGYPVVLKIVSEDVIHKSDAGGVIVGIKSPEQVKEGFEKIMQSVKSKFPQARIQGISIHKMVPDGLETIIGMSKDPQFGPMIMFGLGGVWVELLKDVSFRLIPIRKIDAEEMVREIKGYKMMTGFRNQPAVDVSKLEEMLLKVSEFIERNPNIKELDLNPVIALTDDAVAVDARIITED